MADTAAPSPTPISSSTPSTTPQAIQTVSPDATKIALALTAIFVMCIFGTAFYARRYIRHLDPNPSQLRRQNNGMYQRYYYYRRAGGQLQTLELPRGSRTGGSREGAEGSRVKRRKGLTEDKIARFPVVDFRAEDLVHIDASNHGHVDGVVEPPGTVVPHGDTPEPPVRGEKQGSLQQQTHSESLLTLERFPTISKAIASIRPSTATTKHVTMAADEERAQPSGDVPSRISCSICTDDLVEGVRVRRLPCGHVFHPGCLDPWLMERAKTCPLW